MEDEFGAGPGARREGRAGWRVGVLAAFREIGRASQATRVQHYREQQKPCTMGSRNPQRLSNTCEFQIRCALKQAQERERGAGVEGGGGMGRETGREGEEGLEGSRALMGILVFCSLSLRNWRSLLQSLPAVTDATMRTATKMATPSIQPAPIAEEKKTGSRLDDAGVARLVCVLSACAFSMRSVSVRALENRAAAHT